MLVTYGNWHAKTNLAFCNLRLAAQGAPKTGTFLSPRPTLTAGACASQLRRHGRAHGCTLAPCAYRVAWLWRRCPAHVTVL